MGLSLFFYWFRSVENKTEIRDKKNREKNFFLSNIFVAGLWLCPFIIIMPS